MDESAIQSLGERVLKAVREHVERSIKALLPRIEQLEARQPEKGEKGEPGEPGKSVDTDALKSAILAEIPKPADGKSVTPEDVAPLIAEKVAEAVAAIPPPLPGKDADPELIRAEVAKAVAEIEIPKGEKGDTPDVAPIAAQLEASLANNIASLRAELAQEVTKAVAAIPPAPPGKDAEPIHPDTVRAMVLEEVRQAVALIPQAKDGAPGRDAAQLDILPSLDESRSYPRGTWASYMGGIVRAVRPTEPIIEGLEKSGWEVVVDGIAGIVTEQGEDPREITVSSLLTSGVKASTTFRVPTVIDRGVHRDSEQYKAGDGVTSGGSFWIAQKDDPPGKPGEADSGWRLAVKKGRDGKDGGDPPARGPVRI
jgi:hypothetical protein